MKPNHIIILSAASFLAATAFVPVLVQAANPTTQTATQLAVAQPTVGLKGSFVAGEKPTTGTARIITEDGHRYLVLDAAFSTSDQGPDLHVLLDPAAQPGSSYENQGSVINLGKLRSYSGEQRYPIPDVIELSDYNSVVIWCRMANATFGYAPL
jgi:Electron transfer DM13